jgi:hypothetical protein
VRCARGRRLRLPSLRHPLFFPEFGLLSRCGLRPGRVLLAVAVFVQWCGERRTQEFTGARELDTLRGGVVRVRNPESGVCRRGASREVVEETRIGRADRTAALCPRLLGPRPAELQDVRHYRFGRGKANGYS